MTTITVPERPEYDDTNAARLDRALNNGLDAAREMNDEYHEALLRNTLAAWRVEHND